MKTSGDSSPAFQRTRAQSQTRREPAVELISRSCLCCSSSLHIVRHDQRDLIDTSAMGLIMSLAGSEQTNNKSPARTCYMILMSATICVEIAISSLDHSRSLQEVSGDDGALVCNCRPTKTDQDQSIGITGAKVSP